MKTLFQIMIVFAVAAFALSGCAAPLQIMTPAQEPLGHFRQLEIAAPKNDVIGKINSEVVHNIMNSAIERILDLKHFSHIIVADSINLKPEIESRIIRLSAAQDSLSTAILKITIVEYDEGNGFLRFLFGMFAGSGKVTLELSVINRQSNREILKAKSTADITGAFSSANNVVDPLSRAINNFVEDHFVKENEK
jgi:hypothetical protein